MSEVCRCGGALAMRRKRSAFSGTDQAVYQCEVASCSRVSGRVPARIVADLGWDEFRELPFVVRIRHARPNSKRRRYQAALRSPHWRRLKEIVFERSKGLCEVKGWGCTGRATELGHISYDRLGHEREDDVEACCRACNQDERRERIIAAVFGANA